MNLSKTLRVFVNLLLSCMYEFTSFCNLALEVEYSDTNFIQSRGSFGSFWANLVILLK